MRADDVLVKKLLEVEFAGVAGGGSPVSTEYEPSDDMLRVLRHDPTIPPPTALFHYFRSGLEAVRALEHVLRAIGRLLGARGERVLEFACGYGRITRFLARRIPRHRHWAADILPDAVQFVRNAFGVRGVVSHAEPRRFRPWRRFDLIFVASLFSHLPEHRFEGWLARLYRLLRPRGVLVFTAINAAASPDIDKDPSGFTFVPRSESERLPPSEYGSTFVTAERMSAIAARCGVRFLHRIPNAVWCHQDLYIASRRDLPALAALTHTPQAWGRIDAVTRTLSGGIEVTGWAGSPRAEDPVVAVTLHADPIVVPAVAGTARPDVARFHGRACLAQSGWHARVEPAAGFVIACARLRSGVSACVDARWIEKEIGSAVL